MAEGDAPKKYIRTFAGDMAAVQSGARPDLAPLQPQVQQEAAADSSESAAAAPNSGHILPPRPTMPLSVPIARQTPPLSATPSPVPPQPKPPQPPRPSTETSQLKTYSGDFSERIKAMHASTATLIAAEEDARPTPVTRIEKPHAREGVLYGIAGAVLLVIGAAGAFYAYARFLEQAAPVLVTPLISAPIFVDEREEISGTDGTLMKKVEQSLAHSLAPGTIRFLYMPIATSTDSSVFSALQLPAPASLLRNVHAEGSMAGVLNVASTQSVFFILSVASYSETFAAMLSWEPRLPRDLATLFPPVAVSAVAATSTATSTPARTTLGFHDEVIAKHDARVYRDAAGNTLMVYGYWNQATLVIARNSTAFAELMGRLATSRK